MFMKVVHVWFPNACGIENNSQCFLDFLLQVEVNRGKNE